MNDRLWHRWHRMTGATAISALFLLGGLTTSQGRQLRDVHDGQWFAATSPWNSKVPAGIRALPGSTSFLAAYAKLGAPINVNTNTWTPLLLDAGASPHRATLKIGSYSFYGVPITDDVLQGARYFAREKDTDASVCIYDPNLDAFFNFWSVKVSSEVPLSIEARAGAVFPISGAGWWDNTLQPWAGRASGASYCAGVIRRAEMNTRMIPHALAIGWPNGLIRAARLANAVQFPAKTTDGSGTDPTIALPMGSRLQLDPTLTPKKLAAMGLTSDDVIVATAFQQYGAYVVDSSHVFAIYFESGLGKGSLPYRISDHWPRIILNYIRVIPGPKYTALDSRFTVGAPVDTAPAQIK